jgi:hypothetical protein
MSRRPMVREGTKQLLAAALTEPKLAFDPINDRVELQDNHLGEDENWSVRNLQVASVVSTSSN